ncbi:ATP-binding protein [Streptomyces sp. NPDC020379]|uniref:ATP-binding protein n=1 Tax=Streptomyces sp. NPDC020379 TaxID=3365071 RepID=UPI003792D5CA
MTVIAQSTGQQYRVRLREIEPETVTRMRSIVRNHLHLWGVGGESQPDVDNAQLVVSELLANVVRHTDGVCELCLSLADGTLTIEVRDQSSELPVAHEPAESDESGRGLLLVQALAQSWEVTPYEVGKSIMVSLALSGLPSSAPRGGAE